jgi:hypothetical protein
VHGGAVGAARLDPSATVRSGGGDMQHCERSRPNACVAGVGKGPGRLWVKPGHPLIEQLISASAASGHADPRACGVAVGHREVIQAWRWADPTSAVMRSCRGQRPRPQKALRFLPRVARAIPGSLLGERQVVCAAIWATARRSALPLDPLGIASRKWKTSGTLKRSVRKSNQSRNAAASRWVPARGTMTA